MTTACGNNQMGDPRVCMECLMPGGRLANALKTAQWDFGRGAGLA